MVALMVILTFVTFILVDGLVQWNQARAGHDRVPALPKKVEKTGANLGAGPFFHLRSSSGPAD